MRWVVGSVEVWKNKKSNTKLLVVSDSKYVVDSVLKMGFGWKKADCRSGKMPIWKACWWLIDQVDFKWIKGHNNHPQNEEMMTCCYGYTKYSVSIDYEEGKSL
jgi:ribonuclease HI